MSNSQEKRSVAAIKTATSRFGRGLILVALVPLMVVGVLLFLFLLLLSSPLIGTWWFARVLTFRIRCRGRYFLVVSRKRGWFDFVQNNVIPVLPPTLTPVWWSETRSGEIKKRPPVLRHLPAKAYSLSKPYVLHVTLMRRTLIPLHSQFQPLKASRTGRSAATQAVIETLLATLVSGSQLPSSVHPDEAVRG